MRYDVWRSEVLAKHGGTCANCGGGDKVEPRMILPEEAGGSLDPSNGVALCRPCDIALEATLARRQAPNRRPVNFWVSSDLYERLKTINGFGSISQLVRHMMSYYIVMPSRFEDLAMYQDDGKEVKINVWANSKDYQTFKEMVRREGVTVTDALKSLLVLYGTDVDPRLKPRGEAHGN